MPAAPKPMKTEPLSVSGRPLTDVRGSIFTSVGEFIDEDDWLDDVTDQSPNPQSPNQLF